MILFHVSYKNLGKEPKLRPSVSERRLPGEDGTTPRISCAPRIADCLRMFPWRDYRNKVWVYACSVPKGRGRPLSAEGRVPDWERGKREEYWLTKPMVFERIGRVRMFRVLAVVREEVMRFWGWTGSGRKDVFQDDYYLFPGEHRKLADQMELSMKQASRRVRAEWAHKMKSEVTSWK